MAFVQGTSNTAGAGFALAYASNVTAGNLLITTIRANKSGFTSFGVSDSSNGAWVVPAAGQNTVNASIVLGFAYFLNTVGGVAPTVTWTGVTAGGSVCIGEYSGYDSFRLAGGLANAASGTTVTSGTIATLVNDLIIGYEGVQTPGVVASTSGETLRVGSTNLSNCYVCFGDAISAGGSTSANFTTSVSTAWCVGLAAFYLASAQPSGGGWMNRERRFVNKR